MFARFSSVPLILLLSGVAEAFSLPDQAQNGPFARQRWFGGLSGFPREPPPTEFDRLTSDAADQTLTKQVVELPIDHFAECSDTYPNRYWVEEKWYKRGGPVFVLDAGEENAAYEVSSMKQKGSFFRNFLEEFGGIGIVWEHRYYGKSWPEDKEDRTWLTIEQALADIPTMAANFSLPSGKFPHIDLTPASTPWIMVGGSYPGIRAAMSREKYPNTFHAAWAASAPVQAKIDMSSYFQPIIPGMKHWNFSSCVSDIQAATKRIDNLLDKPSTAAKLKAKFFKNGANLTNEQFATSLSTIFWGWQGGLYAGGIDDYCAFIQKDPSGDPTPPGGWAPVKGADWVVNRMSKAKNYYLAWKYVQQAFMMDEQKSWDWQYCTQFGFLQASGPELHHLVSKYNSVAWQEQRCRDAFPEIKHWPTAKKVNSEYGGWNMRPSNTFWTAGQYDPWRTLSTLSDLPQAPHPVQSQEIPACGVSTPVDKIFGHVLPESAHMFEFYSSKEARAMQKLFAKAVHQWLPCFKKKTKAEICPHIPPKCKAKRETTLLDDKRSVHFSS